MMLFTFGNKDVIGGRTFFSFIPKASISLHNSLYLFRGK